MRVALVSRELHPYVGGGIAPVVAGLARLLRPHAQVTVVTSERHHALHRKLVREGDPRVLPADVRLVWVPEDTSPPTDAAYSVMHRYSAEVLRALKRAYPDSGPDLIEFCDYLGEGFVTTQARHTADPWLDRTTVAVRAHTTAYMAQVLDGHLAQDFASRATFEMERYVLQHADRFLWPGGDILGTYQRVYGHDRLAAEARTPDAFLVEGEPSPEQAPPPTSDGLRLLFLGRTERRKGIANLIRALRGVEAQNWQLSIVGGDTDTGPLGTSLRAQLELMAEGDDRIRFQPAVPRHQVGELIEQHHVVLLPSLWECWPNVGREALMHNRPVFATPVGGLLEMVRPGVSGFLAHDTSYRSLRKALGALLADVAEVDTLIDAGGPRQVFEELNGDESRVVDSYSALAGAVPSRPKRRGRHKPLVSVVIPYFRLEDHLWETVESVARQTYPAIEIIVVNDGCFRPQDVVLDQVRQHFGARVVNSPNSGLSTARNTGIEVTRGSYVLPLDADDVLDPSMVARCVDVLERDQDLAYVTSWLTYMDERGHPVRESDGYRPFGNWSTLLIDRNVGGSATALFRRSVFDDVQYHPDLTSYEDWYLYQELQAEQLWGAVIPEYLITYRVRTDSMTRQIAVHNRELLRGEMAAHLEERKIQWQPRNA